MPHKILKCLGIHTGFSHIRTICMPANMRCDPGHLKFVCVLPEVPDLPVIVPFAVVQKPSVVLTSHIFPVISPKPLPKVELILPKVKMAPKVRNWRELWRMLNR